MMIVCCHYLVAQAAASAKMRICILTDFQTCKMRMVLRIVFVDVTGKLRMRTQYYKLKITYFVEIFIVGTKFHHCLTTVTAPALCTRIPQQGLNYPLSLFRIPQLKNSAFPWIAKLPFARIVQLMCSQSIATSGVPRCLPFVFFWSVLPKNRVVFFYNFY